MCKWKLPKEPVDVEEPKFFTGAIIGMLICVPFWMMVIHFFF